MKFIPSIVRRHGFRVLCASAAVLCAGFLSTQSRICAKEASPLPCPLGEGWEFCEDFSDEFNGTSLDESKWWGNNPTWSGRQPAKFLTENVSVSDGFLRLRATNVPEDYYSEADRQQGYEKFGTAAVKSKETVLYGYFEVRTRAMPSAGSSSFWFYGTTDAQWTEIDVFESCGRNPNHDHTYHMNAHVFRAPDVKKHISFGGTHPLTWNSSDEFHVYALEWTKDFIRWYIDGEVVRELPNKHWHQPLTVNFDSETMPEWFGLPNPTDLPSEFCIDYIRYWKQNQ